LDKQKKEKCTFILVSTENKENMINLLKKTRYKTLEFTEFSHFDFQIETYMDKINLERMKGE
jgi:hypothetical protein